MRAREVRCYKMTTHVVEELQEMDVIGLGAEMLLEEEVDGALEHERVVDRDVIHALHAEPAGLAAAGDGLVHHVVRHKEERLQLSIPGRRTAVSIEYRAQGQHKDERTEWGKGGRTAQKGTQRHAQARYTSPARQP